MSFELRQAIYFDGNEYPVPTGNQPFPNPNDWVNADVPGLGKTSCTLFCRAMPWRRQEDYFEYFFKNEIIWYVFYVALSENIIKILKITSYNLTGSAVSDLSKPFPTYSYTLASNVEDVVKTDDGEYETYREFDIVYRGDVS